jgi:CheY-like chemotaxis protein
MPDLPHVSPGEDRIIIIADADEGNATHVERQLRRAGVKQPVVTFKNGDDLHTFLDAAAQKDEASPCVLFLDPSMPGANGFDPVRWIRREENLSSTEVVIFANAEDADVAESASELGVHLFLKKHPDLGVLAEITGYLCGGTGDDDAAGEQATLSTPPKPAAA